MIGLPINIIGVLVFVLAFAWIWNKERPMVDLSGNDCWNDQLEYHDGIGELCLCNPFVCCFMNYDISKTLGLSTI